MFDHAKYKEEVNYLGSKREKKSQTDISKVISGPHEARDSDAYHFDHNLFNAIGEINLLIKDYESKLLEEIARIKTITVDADAIMLSVANGLYAKATGLRGQIDYLKLKRAAMIDKIVKYSTFSVQEVIWILEQFEEYYNVINFGNRSFLVPLDFTLVTRGSRKFISEEELHTKLIACDMAPDGNRSYYANVVPAYKIMDERVTFTNGEDFVTVRAAKNPINRDVKYGVSVVDAKTLQRDDVDRDFTYFEDTPSKIVFNEDMKQLAPIIELNLALGISFYQNMGDEARPNSAATNVIQKEEILSFIEYFIECKFYDETITLKNAFKEWNERYVLGRKKG